MTEKKVNTLWEKIKDPVKNHTKIYLLTYYVDEILSLYEKLA